MHKRLMCLLISLLLVFCTFVFPSAADGADDEITILYMSNAPIITTARSTNQFEEGQPVELHFELEYLYHGEIESEILTIWGVCAYLDAPGTGYDVEAYEMSYDFQPWVINGLNDLYDRDYPNAERQRDATSYYNCHSYAWYSTALDNCYWINDPENFHWKNNYYVEVSTPAVGDIICYYNGNVNLHSGVVTGLTGQASNGECGNSNTVEVLSKWGPAGLYQHNGYECPYTSYNGGNATTVKYFRCNHTYTYSYKLTNQLQHRVTCSRCSYTFWENHNYGMINGTRTCLTCGYIPTGNIIMIIKPTELVK